MIPQPKAVPHRAGIYFFRKSRTPLYIGKARDLAKRLRSYWRKNASAKARTLLTQATSVDWVETPNEVEALLKEVESIKRYRPKFNVLLRDDKGYAYVGITREEFPRIFVTHQPIQTRNSKFEIRKKSKIPNSKRVPNFVLRASNFFTYLGPFTSARALKNTLKLLRRTFPYCTCRRPHAAPCLSSQLGLCPGYCCRKQNPGSPLPNPAEYQNNIRRIRTILAGKRNRLSSELRREMKAASQNQNFEKAAELRDQIAGIENIFEHRHTSATSLPRRRTHWVKIEQNLKMVLGTRRAISRVEGYDISNIAGREATGSMVVFVDGVRSKSEYRKFRIKTVVGPNDVTMLKEVIRRRLGHREWAYPDLVLIDGGKPQLNAVKSVLPAQANFALAALAKREEELYQPHRATPVRLATLPPETAFFLQRVRDESHRFARVYHHILRSRSVVR